MSPGLGEFTLPKRQFWYEEFLGFTAFKAVWLGKQRKKLFGHVEYLVLYRNYKECVIDWIDISKLTDRFALRVKINNKVCRDKELNELFDCIITESLKEATLKNSI